MPRDSRDRCRQAFMGRQSVDGEDAVSDGAPWAGKAGQTSAMVAPATSSSAVELAPQGHGRSSRFS